jgi:hypothetical protein
MPGPPARKEVKIRCVRAKPDRSWLHLSGFSARPITMILVAPISLLLLLPQLVTTFRRAPRTDHRVTLDGVELKAGFCA